MFTPRAGSVLVVECWSIDLVVWTSPTGRGDHDDSAFGATAIRLSSSSGAELVAAFRTSFLWTPERSSPLKRIWSLNRELLPTPDESSLGLGGGICKKRPCLSLF